MKKGVLFFMVLILAVCAIFAGGTSESDDTSSSTIRAALLSNPRGTSLFVNLGIDGFIEACEKWGIQGDVIECKNTAEYEENGRAAANEGYDLILGSSWESGSILSELAEIYDDIAFGISDTIVDSPNVKCINFWDAEGAYLVGVIAALTVDGESHNYGSIHVSNSESSFKWRYGFSQGVLSIDPEAKFTYNYVNGYSEVNLAYEMALQQYELGCKFINSCCAGGDPGTLQAAKEKGFYTAGQDVDLTTPDNPWIVTSQLKKADKAIAYLVDCYMSGNWNTENENLGVADNVIGAVWATDESVNPRHPNLSDEDMIIIKQAVEDISSGKIDMRNLPDWQTTEIPLIEL